MATDREDVCDAWCAEKENKDKCPRPPCPEWERKVVGYDIEYTLVVPQPGLCEHEKQAILLQSQLTAWKLFYPPNVIYKVYDNRRLVNLLYGNRPVDSILQSPDRIGAAVLASRGSSGFDRVQPGGTSVPRQPQSGSGFNTVQPGGTSVARQPQSGSGFNTVKSNSAMDRLTGDGMGGARSSAPGLQLPDTSRGPNPARQQWCFIGSRSASIRQRLLYGPARRHLGPSTASVRQRLLYVQARRHRGPSTAATAAAGPLSDQVELTGSRKRDGEPSSFHYPNSTVIVPGLVSGMTRMGSCKPTENRSNSDPPPAIGDRPEPTTRRCSPKE